MVMALSIFKREGELVAEDVASLRGEFRREGFRLAGLLRFFTQLFKKGGRQRSSASSKKHETHDA